MTIGQAENFVALQGPGVASTPIEEVELEGVQQEPIDSTESNLVSIEDHAFKGKLHKAGDALLVEVPKIEMDQCEYFIGALTLAAPLIQQGLKMWAESRKPKVSSAAASGGLAKEKEQPAATGKIGEALELLAEAKPLIDKFGFKGAIKAVQAYLDTLSQEGKQKLEDEFWKGTQEHEYDEITFE